VKGKGHENSVLTRIFGPKENIRQVDGERPINKKLHDLYSSSDIVREIVSSRMR
jgi:hypothetical protein